MRVPILLYHGIDMGHSAAAMCPRWDPAYAIPGTSFTAQMAWLAASGTRVLGLDDLVNGKWRDDRSGVVLTFDDGYESDVACVLPELQARGFTATFFVETGALDTPGRLSRARARTLVTAGMCIGSHTATHRFLSDLPTWEVRQELLDSKKLLEDVTGVRVRFLSLPGGRFDRRTEAVARECGYDAVCTSVPGASDPMKPGFLLPRLCIRRRTRLSDFQRLVRLKPLRLAQEHVRYRTLRMMKLLLGRTGYAGLREALLRIATAKG